jgi:hypothetical protein
MSKDWASHKAEIKRLHIDEGKSLEEVREILKARHDFHASYANCQTRSQGYTDKRLVEYEHTN